MDRTYAIITAARDEATSLPRLAEALLAQTVAPSRWVIVENGSSDATFEVASALAEETEWIRPVTLPEAGARERGGPIVRALAAGLEALGGGPGLVVNVDADVTMGDTYFERLLEAFAANDRLGIASGSAWELDAGTWQQRFVTGGTVWGATRAYRWECLQQVLPLEQRHGWDGIDQLKARARGWQTQVLDDLPFHHHRTEGELDGLWSHWLVNGETAYYMGYRPWYLALRTAHHVRRNPRAVGMLVGFTRSAIRRRERLADEGARRVLRDDQRLGNLLRRRREALGLERSTGDADPTDRA